MAAELMQDEFCMRSVARVQVKDKTKPVSNLFGYFDRGKFLPRQEEYLELIRKAGPKIVSAEIVVVTRRPVKHYT